MDDVELDEIRQSMYELWQAVWELVDRLGLNTEELLEEADI